MRRRLPPSRLTLAARRAAFRETRSGRTSLRPNSGAAGIAAGRRLGVATNPAALRVEAGFGREAARPKRPPRPDLGGTNTQTSRRPSRPAGGLMRTGRARWKRPRPAAAMPAPNPVSGERQRPLAVGRFRRAGGAVLYRIRAYGARILTAASPGPLELDLSGVTYLPSGFLAVLWGFHDAGASVLLHAPEPNVRAMLWFRLYAMPEPSHAGELGFPDGRGGSGAGRPGNVWRLTGEAAFEYPGRLGLRGANWGARRPPEPTEPTDDDDGE